MTASPTVGDTVDTIDGGDARDPGDTGLTGGTGSTDQKPARHRRMSGTPRRAWTILAVAALSRALLLSAVSLVIWAAVPAVWGWVPTTVVSDSMAPGIRLGDVVIAMPTTASNLRLGQVVLVNDPDHPDRLRLHRFVSTDADGNLVLRGDANRTNDSSHIAPADVRGIGVLRVPWVGLPGIWLRDGNLGALAVLGGALLALLWLSRLDVGHFRPPRAPRPASSVGGLVVTALILTAVGAALPTSVAQARFTAVASNPASTVAALSSYPCLQPAAAQSPYFLYRFNESTGTAAADSSGNARTGTLQGTAATGHVAGSCLPNASPALQLDGTAGFLATPSFMTGPNVFSIEIWFNTTTNSGGKLIGFGNAQYTRSSRYDRHLYMTDAGEVVFGVYPGTVRTITSQNNYNDGAWHLATATLSSAGMALYVDGVSEGTNTGTTTAEGYSGWWKVGFDNLNGWVSTPSSQYFAGTIDGAAYYTTALSASQVAAHYAAGR